MHRLRFIAATLCALGLSVGAAMADADAPAPAPAKPAPAGLCTLHTR